MAVKVRVTELTVIPEARWQALKDYLTGRIENLEALSGDQANGTTVVARASHVSACRGALAKMRELEAGR